MIDEARSWCGVPFVFNGRSRKGVDCIGLLVLSLAAVTGQTLELQPYSRLAGTDHATGELNRFARRVRLEDAAPGDVLILNYNHRLTHLGLLSDRRTVIHALAKARVVCEQSLDHPDVAGRIVAAYRFDIFGESL